jgi:hypothetical protein
MLDAAKCRGMRSSRVFAVAVAVLLSVAAGSGIAVAQEVPKPPPEAIPVLQIISPTTWAVCNAPSQVLGTISYVQTLIPANLKLPYNPADAIAIATPVTAAFFDTCALFPLPPNLPVCTADASFATLGMIGAPGPVALVSLQIAAIENATAGAAAGQTPLSDAIAQNGGCKKAATAAEATPTPPGAAAADSAGAPQAVVAALDVSAAGAGEVAGSALDAALSEIGSAASQVAQNASASDEGLPLARHFATWVLVVMILAGATIATGASAVVARFRRE